jgi:flagellar biosynthetic protein FliP
MVSKLLNHVSNLRFCVVFIFFLFVICIGIELCSQEHSTEKKVSDFVESALKNQQSEDLLPVRHQLRILGFITLLALIPFGVIMMTSFTRISIIFHFLRQALGYQQVPSNQIVIGLSLILTGFVMHPVIHEIQEQSFDPYFSHQFKDSQEVTAGIKTEEGMLLEKAWSPLRTFLLKHTREKDLLLFLELGEITPEVVKSSQGADSPYVYDFSEEIINLDTIPWYCLIPAFVMSELRIAFMMGFLLFLPFLIIDMVVASILMSMGMMMLPPVLVSTPFKLLLFILIDGWRLIIEQIVNGF